MYVFNLCSTLVRKNTRKQFTYECLKMNIIINVPKEVGALPLVPGTLTSLWHIQRCAGREWWKFLGMGGMASEILSAS